MSEGTAFHQALVQKLAGRWEGTGTASYPTTQAFGYREVIVFTAHENQNMLHYEQRTWKTMPDGSVLPSHWETGFWRFIAEGAVEISNAQSGGRVEVSRGALTASEVGFIIRVESTAIANDPRMRRIRRIIHLEEDCLRYTMEMETTAVTGLTAHLVAALRRS